jgi:NADPH-dependent ferric siderophore reductase
MRHEAAWIFGAICPERDTGVALVLPEASVPAMQALINELASQLPADRHAVLVMDRAGWHIAHKLNWPDTITPLHLPPYSPELNPIERVWLYLRERFLSHRHFHTYDAIIDACCDAWNALLTETGRIASLGSRA